jgi:hypothetical protein
LQGEVELRLRGLQGLKPSLIWIKAVGIEDGNCEKVTTRMQPSVIVWDLETVPEPHHEVAPLQRRMYRNGMRSDEPLFAELSAEGVSHGCSTGNCGRLQIRVLLGEKDRRSGK